MLCPACGRPAEEGALACASCAVIFSKWKARGVAVAPPVVPRSVLPTPSQLTAFAAGSLLLFAVRERLRPALFILDGVDLGVHETGHLLFGLLGNHFLTVAGGTLLQLIMPLAFVADFRRRGLKRSADVCVAWVGQNFLHIGRYAADARAQELPLVGGGVHDWTYLLEVTGLLTRDVEVGRFLDSVGCALIAWAGVSLWRRGFPPAQRPEY
ncbi:MAG: hypothetical protein Q8T11_06360 [Elusimicrobiota bacterium]|nr:hypothetical protein [Elusimicrobiota bacterium]